MSLKRKETRYHVIFLVLWLVAHIPFLRSDPSIMLDSSRGAFTDEGLYLFQISNLDYLPLDSEHQEQLRAKILEYLQQPKQTSLAV